MVINTASSEEAASDPPLFAALSCVLVLTGCPCSLLHLPQTCRENPAPAGLPGKMNTGKNIVVYLRLKGEASGLEKDDRH